MPADIVCIYCRLCQETPTMNKVFLLIVWATAAITAGAASSRFLRQASSNSGVDEFQTEPRRAVVRPGESVTLLGNAGTPLDKCHFYTPGGTLLDFSRGPDSRSSDQYEYFGRGLDNGECGIRIKMAVDEDDGLFECKVKPTSRSQWERCVTVLRVTRGVFGDDTYVNQLPLLAYNHDAVSVSDLPTFDIDPRSPTTLSRGDDLTITCNADRAINMCRFYLPGRRFLNLDRGVDSASTDEYRYHGSGLRDGECGVTLTRVDPRLTGYVVCKVGQRPERVTGAWETDALEITTNEVSAQNSGTTRRPSQSQGKRTTPSTYESSGHQSGTNRRPSQSQGNRPAHESSDESSTHPSVTNRRPSQSQGNRPTYETSDESSGHQSGTNRRPSQSQGNRPTYESSDEITTRQSRPSQSYGNRPTPSTDEINPLQSRPSQSNGNRPTHSSDENSTHQSRPSQSNGNKPTHSTGGSEVEECGRVKLLPAALVTNGQGTEQGQWPWHVAMYQNKGKDLSYICGGSLISRSAVVTAAHCVTRRPTERLVNPESLVLYFGKYRRLVWSEGGVQNKQIDKIHVHPTYNGTSLQGDIAVIILKSPVDYTDYVRHVCLWEPSKTDLSEVVGKEGTVVGWGLDESGESPPELMMARMPVVDHQTCIWSYQEFFSEFTSNKTLCAGFKNGTSVCNGDSGGGLVFPTKKRGENASEWHLRALVSLSAPKGVTRVCDPNHYVVFTDVAKYLSWISPFVR